MTETTTPWYHGNAGQDASEHRGWLLGHFLDPTVHGLRATTDVEIKWGIHPAGDTREAWTVGDHRTAVLLLVSGRFRLDMTTGSVTLTTPGDYVVWGPGTDHSWHAEEDSTVLTIRWPSTPA